MSPSEATTKSFDYPAQQSPDEANRTAPANQWPTAPAYLGPDQMAVAPQYSAIPGADTNALAQKRSKAPFVILGVLGFVLLAVIAALAFIVSHAGRSAPYGYVAPPNAGMPPSAPGPNGGGHPEIPDPPPPPEPPGATATGPLASLIYPGSHQDMNVEDEDGTRVVKMTTSDPSDKVIDWYAARLPHSSRVTVPFVRITTITNGTATVIIKPGKPTEIMVTHGDK